MPSRLRNRVPFGYVPLLRILGNRGAGPVRVSTRLAWGGIDEPKDARPETRAGETRLKSRLLTPFLCVILFLVAGIDLASLWTRGASLIPWFAYAIVLGALGLNLLGRYREAAVLTLALFPAIGLTFVVLGTDPRLAFTHFVTGVIAANLLLDRKGAIAFGLGCLVLVAATPWLMPEHAPSFWSVLNPFVLVALSSALSLLLTVQRDTLERDRQAALRGSEERLLLALDAAHLGTWEWDTSDGAVRWSERVEAMCGVPAGGLGASVDGYLECVHPDDRPLVSQAFRDAADGLKDEFETLHRLVWRDGSERWIQVQGRATRTTSRVRRVHGTVLDVTARKIAEIDRDALIQELETKNSELERFTYTVSHDLKSPLITVRGFLSSIQQDVQEGRSDRLGEDMGRIFAATSRMQKLLDELLNLSRVGRVVHPPERIAFGELAREAVDLVRGRLDPGHIDVLIEEPLPDVFGDRSGLLQLLQNLLDNASKFMGDRKNPKIVVGSRPPRTDGLPVLFVRDNGMGIGAHDLERVTGLFEKADEKSEGAGLGLAIVKRVVEFHGGRFWLESQGVGEGTSACFTLKPPPVGV